MHGGGHNPNADVILRPWDAPVALPSSQPQWTCSACGSKHPTNERFCSSCGAPQHAGAVPAAGKPHPTVAPMGQVSSPPHSHASHHPPLHTILTTTLTTIPTDVIGIIFGYATTYYRSDNTLLMIVGVSHPWRYGQDDGPPGDTDPQTRLNILVLDPTHNYDMVYHSQTDHTESFDRPPLLVPITVLSTNDELIKPIDKTMIQTVAKLAKTVPRGGGGGGGGRGFRGMCTAGCGFYGSEQWYGYCSSCWKHLSPELRQAAAVAATAPPPKPAAPKPAASTAASTAAAAGPSPDHSDWYLFSHELNNLFVPPLKSIPTMKSQAFAAGNPDTAHFRKDFIRYQSVIGGSTSILNSEYEPMRHHVILGDPLSHPNERVWYIYNEKREFFQPAIVTLKNKTVMDDGKEMIITEPVLEVKKELPVVPFSVADLNKPKKRSSAYVGGGGGAWSSGYDTMSSKIISVETNIVRVRHWEFVVPVQNRSSYDTAEFNFYWVITRGTPSVVTLPPLPLTRFPPPKSNAPENSWRSRYVTSVTYPVDAEDGVTDVVAVIFRNDSARYDPYGAKNVIGAVMALRLPTPLSVAAGDIDPSLLEWRQIANIPPTLRFGVATMNGTTLIAWNEDYENPIDHVWTMDLLPVLTMKDPGVMTVGMQPWKQVPSFPPGIGGFSHMWAISLPTRS